MKKYVKWLFVLAVVGVAACEKTELPPARDDANTSDITLLNNSGNESAIMGYWKATLEDVQLGIEKGYYEVAYRFWEDGDGYFSMEGYNDKGKCLYSSNSGFTYKVEDNILSFCYDCTEQWGDVEISVDGNVLIIYNSDGNGLDLHLVKHEDADKRFMGDWSTLRYDGEFYYDEHIAFDSPTDCCTYSYKYADVSSRPIDSSYIAWYKYEFNDEMIIISSPYLYTPYLKAYYRFEGGKLYLSNTKDGVETCYSTIKK